MTSRPCVCGVVTSDPGNYTGVVWSEALWVEGGCGRWVEGGLRGWEVGHRTPRVSCSARRKVGSQAKAGQGSNPKEAKLRQAECKTELQQFELVQTSTEKTHGKRNFQNLNAFFCHVPLIYALGVLDSFYARTVGGRRPRLKKNF